MMRRLISLSMALFVTVVSPSARAQAAPPVCNASAADSGVIIDIIRSWYAALGAGDAKRFHAFATPDFVIFEDGRRLTGDDPLAIARKHLVDGAQARWAIAQSKVEVDCNSALATFTTVGTFDQAGRHMEVTFLESAVLRKDSRAWRIQFFHSTAVPPEQK